MRITRKTNIIVKTERKTFVQPQTSPESFFCEQCCEPMISTFMSVDFFGFSSRIIYRLIESGSVHFLETETGEIFICPASVKKALETNFT